MLPLRVLLISLLGAANTVVHVVPLLAVALVKALLPSDRLRKASNPVLTAVAESWIAVNNWTLDYGPRGREAITTLLRRGADAGLVPAIGEIEYVTAR